MKRHAGFVLVVSALLMSSFLSAQEIPLRNWTVPPYHSMGGSGGLTTMTDVTPGIAFVGVTPCRLVDTTNAGFPATYGPPALFANTPRDFDLNNDPRCPGIPAGVDAYSLNITAAGTQGPGFIVIYPQGGAVPVVSTLNYVGGQTVANAAIVPAAANGGVTVIAGTSGTHLIIDINGYFTDEYNPGTSFFASSVAGPAIFALNSSSADLSVALVGQATATSGITRGIHGSTVSNWDGSAGVFGLAGATSGATHGVHGETASVGSDAAGVLGRDGSGPPVLVGLPSAGVRGEGKTGVLGISRDTGVEGILVPPFGGSFAAGGSLGTRFGTGAENTTGPWGVFSSGNLGASGTKNFVEPHPIDPTKVILYTALEGRTADTYFRGTARFAGGEAVIEVPEDFRFVTSEKGLTVQITAIGGFASTYVESRSLDRIVVRSSSDVEFDYVVHGIRRAFEDFRTVQTGYEFVPESPFDRIPGHLTEEAKRRLIANGTYNQDGSVNMETARRLGWDKEWEKRARPRPEASPTD